MSNLAIYQPQVTDIQTQAVSLMKAHPVAKQYLEQLIEPITYLAYRAASQDYQNNIGRIQQLIDFARADQQRAINTIAAGYQQELQTLNGDLRRELSQICAVLEVHSDRLQNHEHRIQQLEEQAPQVIYVEAAPIERQVHHHHGSNFFKDYSWMSLLFVFFAIVCTLVGIESYKAGSQPQQQIQQEF